MKESGLKNTRTIIINVNKRRGKIVTRYLHSEPKAPLSTVFLHIYLFNYLFLEVSSIFNTQFFSFSWSYFKLLDKVRASFHVLLRNQDGGQIVVRIRHNPKANDDRFSPCRHLCCLPVKLHEFCPQEQFLQVG
jgi:hypothetical protein